MSAINIHTDILELLHRKLQGESFSAEEQAQWEQWLSVSPHNRALAEKLQNDEQLLTSLVERHSLNKKQAWDKVAAGIWTDQQQQIPVRSISFLRKWSWVAASLILLLALGTFFWYQSSKKTAPLAKVETAPTAIPPGKEGAILTLADGTLVLLDTLKNGIIASQSGSSVLLMNGQLSYNPNEKTGATVAYNTMSTPKGRRFKLTLPDGTLVWLNSVSSIRYPTLFTGKERKVEVSGEAYFEVAKNASMPFRVSVNNKAVVEVLGTHFNINAYDNEKVLSTTLLEGSIKVNNTLIKPGQQAQIDRHSNIPIKLIDKADIEKVMAWKNDLFNFEGASLEDAMKQLERWYDIEVVYEKNIPSVKLTGKMTKDITLNDLLIVLKELGVHSRLQGRKLIVLPVADR